MQFKWGSPETPNGPIYIKHSISKVHIELLEPNGLVKSDKVRLGLYGMEPGVECGIRRHAEEKEEEGIYKILASDVNWKRSNEPYALHLQEERSYHPSVMSHASRAHEVAFYKFTHGVATSLKTFIYMREFLGTDEAVGNFIHSRDSCLI